MVHALFSFLKKARQSLSCPRAAVSMSDHPEFGHFYHGGPITAFSVISLFTFTVNRKALVHNLYRMFILICVIVGYKTMWFFCFQVMFMSSAGARKQRYHWSLVLFSLFPPQALNKLLGLILIHGFFFIVYFLANVLALENVTEITRLKSWIYRKTWTSWPSHGVISPLSSLNNAENLKEIWKTAPMPPRTVWPCSFWILIFFGSVYLIYCFTNSNNDSNNNKFEWAIIALQNTAEFS